MPSFRTGGSSTFQMILADLLSSITNKVWLRGDHTDLPVYSDP